MSKGIQQRVSNIRLAADNLTFFSVSVHVVGIVVAVVVCHRVFGLTGACVSCVLSPRRPRPRSRPRPRRSCRRRVALPYKYLFICLHILARDNTQWFCLDALLALFAQLSIDIWLDAFVNSIYILIERKR